MNPLEMVKELFSLRDGNLYIGGQKVLKAWESFQGWYWFGVEQPEKETRPSLWYGFVQGFEDEWGYFDLDEMAPLIARGMVWTIKPQDLPYAGRQY